MPNQGGLQLLPETRKSISVTVPGENRMLYVGIVVLIVSVLLTVGLWFLRSKKINEFLEISNDLKAIGAQIDANIEIVNSVATVSQQIGNISKLLDGHVYWSRALGRMENLLSPQIQIDSLSGNVISGEISLKAFSPSYTIIAKQIASFVSDPFIKDVSIGEITTQTSGRLEFSMMLKVTSSEFFKYNQ
jgi:Tfp pilus assembly protein PilN